VKLVLLDIDGVLAIGPDGKDCGDGQEILPNQSRPLVPLAPPDTRVVVLTHRQRGEAKPDHLCSGSARPGSWRGVRRRYDGPVGSLPPPRPCDAGSDQGSVRGRSSSVASAGMDRRRPRSSTTVRSTCRESARPVSPATAYASDARRLRDVKSNWRLSPQR